MGIISTIKNLAPFVLYVISIILVLRALIGKTEWSLLYLVGILPLRNVIDRFHSFPMGKDVVDILVIALLVGTFVRSLKSKDGFFVKSGIMPVVWIMIFYMFVSLLIGSDYLNSYSLFDISDPRVPKLKNFYILPMLFFVTINNIRDRKWIWRLVLVMCLSMVLTDYYLVNQLTWFSSLVSRKKIDATFVFLGPNEVAAFYNQFTIVLMSLYYAIKKKTYKMALLGLILVNIYCILFLFSRAAYIAFVIGCFLLFVIKDKKMLIVLCLVVISWQTALPDRVKERILETKDEYGELDKSSEMRLVVWERSLELFSESPISGVGYGVFSEMQYELGDTHNIYLKILAEQGLVGITIFLLLLYFMFINGIRLYTRSADNLEKGLGLGFAIAIIVLMVNNVFGDRWTYMEVSSNIWVFAALVERFNVFIDDEREKRNRIRTTK